MKRFLVAAGVAALAVTSAAGAQSLAVPTKKAGKLTVGFDVPAPGFWNGRATGSTIKNPTGFEAGLAKAIATQLKIGKVQYLRAPFSGLFSPATKPYDFALEEVTITPARAKVVTFSTSYFDANQGVLIRKGLAKPKSIAALKKLQLCAQSTTTGLAYIQHKLRPSKKPLVYSPSSTAAFDAVEAGKCDALILDVPIVVSQSKKKPGAYGGVVGQIVTHEGYGAVMDHGSKLKPDIDKAIKALKANGTINKLQKKWLPFTRVPILK
ncbi:MAG: amino acid ABC transporter substrate-binding protein [Actinobacteria bacterium]|nr:MAG: amino acid ABC transporter substrate-binding protein [Actinomycetota bacterium]